MGNREELLKGARECLLDKGYVQTTARDIANASGVGLAAIGYHFGTKEALLQEAMVETNKEWAQRVQERILSVQVPEDAPFPEWFEQCWNRIIAASREDQRLLQTSIEMLLNVDPSLPVCASIEDGMRWGREALVTLFAHDKHKLTDDQVHAIGGFYHALMIGVRLLHAAAPACAPGARDLTLAMKAIAPDFCLGPTDPEVSG